MKRHLTIKVSPQPDNVTCGPTCLHAIYRYYGEDFPLLQVIEQTHMLEDGGTLDVFLANHALRRNYEVTIYTFNLDVFDPTWFAKGEQHIAERLRMQAEVKRSPKLAIATRGYLEFIELGGKLRFEDLTPALLRRPLKRRTPILTGLSSTYLYHHCRELPDTSEPDDVRGKPAGHFVVVAGYDSKTRQVHVADPYRANPYSSDGQYTVDIRRLQGAILLGATTYDANLLLIEPRKSRARGKSADR